jgi:hypothetical protein
MMTVLCFCQKSIKNVDLLKIIIYNYFIEII